MTFEQAIEKFKELESPEDVLPLLGKEAKHEQLRQLLVAWQKISIKRVKKTEYRGSDSDMVELWKWMWEQVYYDREELKQISMIQGDIDNLMKVLVGNRIIYPDGTISTFARKVLQQMIKMQLRL